jgi:hypothetical protein
MQTTRLLILIAISFFITMGIMVWMETQEDKHSKEGRFKNSIESFMKDPKEYEMKRLRLNTTVDTEKLGGGGNYRPAVPDPSEGVYGGGVPYNGSNHGNPAAAGPSSAISGPYTGTGLIKPSAPNAASTMPMVGWTHKNNVPSDQKAGVVSHPVPESPYSKGIPYPDPLPPSATQPPATQ